MLASVIPTPINLKLSHPQNLIPNSKMEVWSVGTMKSKFRRRAVFPNYALSCRRNPKLLWNRVVRTNASSDGDSGGGASQPTEVEDLKNTSSFGDSYVALFVRMLGLDHDPLDREQAIVALWKYSLGGKKCIDAIMQFRGCINLTVNLLRSESSSTCEAAAGLLRSISIVNVYRVSVAESGAIEEITGLLNKPSLTPEVKEQSICTLWNLSVDEKLRIKIGNTEILPLLIKNLDEEDIKVKEAAGGVLANLALSPCNHKVMVEAGLIPKLAKLLKTDVEASKILRKEARNALLELAKGEYYRILIIEEGLVLVPMVGAAAYKSFRPGLHTWPSLPDGTKIEQSSKGPSRFGASELLLGLNIDDKNVNIEEAKANAIFGRTQQQFLARIGAIECEDENKSQSEFSTNYRYTLLPWMDGVARLVLILELQDESSILKAAESIADASINEHMRVSFKEAGAIKHLVSLLDLNSDPVKWAVMRALQRLSLSNAVCHTIESEGVLDSLFSTLKLSHVRENAMEMTLDVLSRILDPSKELKSKFYDGPVNGSKSKSSTAGIPDVYARITKTRKDVLDSAVISRLVEILKNSSPNLQRKAASILEFVTIMDPSMDIIISVEIESGLDAVFHQRVLRESDDEDEQPETYAIEIEEAGLAVSAASRLLTKLLDSEQFCRNINSAHFIKTLRRILKSNIPLHNKDWVAACLVKLTSLSASASSQNIENPINMEVALYETIPRLVNKMKTAISNEAREAAAVELNRIVSEDVVDSTRAIVAKGGIFPLVKLIEEGSDRGVEAALALLYNVSMDSENHSAIVAAGAVGALKRIVLSQRPQWTRALRLLRTLPT